MKIRYQNTIVYHTQTKTESCINKIEVEDLISTEKFSELLVTREKQVNWLQ